MKKKTSRKTNLEYLKTTHPKGKELQISVHYEEGGPNYFSGGTSLRGYYLSVTAVTRKDGFTSQILGEGTKSLIVEANRFSEKKLAEMAVLAATHPMRKTLQDNVLGKIQAKLSEEPKMEYSPTAIPLHSTVEVQNPSTEVVTDSFAHAPGASAALAQEEFELEQR